MKILLEIDLRYDGRQRRLVFAHQPDPQNSDKDSSGAPIGLEHSNISQSSVFNQYNQSRGEPRKAKKWYGKQGGEVRFEGRTNSFQVLDRTTYEWRMLCLPVTLYHEQANIDRYR